MTSPDPANTRTLIKITITATIITITSTACVTQQKLFGKPSSDWQHTYQSAEKSPEGVTEKASVDTESKITKSSTSYYLQPAAYTSKDNALRQQKKLQASMKSPVTIFEEQDNGTQFYKLQVGPFPNLQEAVKAESAIKSAGFDKVRYIRR